MKKQHFMNILLKYLLIINIVLAIAFVFIAIMLFATHETNYKPYIAVLVVSLVGWLSYVLLWIAINKRAK